MAPPRPGRRRASHLHLTPLSLILLVVLFFTVTASAAGAVLGIDFGTEYLKGALVKPGIPLEIVLTKDSKRKEASVVAFKPSTNTGKEPGSFPERLYGGDALSLQARFPGDVYPNLKPLLGLTPGEDGAETVNTYRGRYPALQIAAVKEMGTVVFKSDSFNDKEMPWSVEELLAMEFKNMRGNAEALAGRGSSVNDAVITIPAFYTADERRAIERAAELAEINVMALVSEGLAVGVNYATSRTFPSISEGAKPEHHLVFDMGAGSTSATVLRFQGRSVKDVGRYNKTVQEVAVVGVGWDRTLGGDALNQVILDDMVNKFLTKPVMKSRGIDGDKVKGHGRTASKLWKEAERVRQVLSANSETRSSFEGLYDDVDFSTKMSRSDFETLAAPFADRVEKPIKEALAAAKLSVDDLDSIILHGGAVRTPFVQKKLEALAGGASKLRSNVNADESAVFGAAFKGAGLSPSFKVKEIRDSDTAGYAAGITYTDGGKERRQALFGITGGAGTKQVTFKDKEDFAFSFYQQVDGTDRMVSTVQTSNLTASMKELESKFGCTKDEIATKFGLKLSAVDMLPEVVTGTVSCEVDGAVKSGGVGDSVKDFFGFGKKKDQEPLGEEEPVEEVDAASSSVSSASSSSSSSAFASSSAKPEDPKKRTEVINVAFTIVPQGLPQAAPAEITRMKDRLVAFDRSDKGRLQREEALNVLEAFTYRARDLLTDAGFEGASTEAQRSAISKLLGTTSDWLYGEGPSAATEALKGKLSDLKALVDPITKRKEEAIARPEKVKALRSSLEQTNSLISMVSEQVEKASSASEKAASWEAEQAASAAAAPEPSTTSTKDDFADLEEPETSASATTTEAPKYSSPADFSPYTDLDLKEVKEAYESVSTWLKSKEKEQDKLSAHEEPALSVKDIEAKATELGKVMQDLLYKKMNAPKPKSSKKPKATKSAKKSKAAKSTMTADAAAEESKGAKPNFITVGEGDEMPTEEEILEMVNKAKGKEKKHDEL